MNSFGGRGRLQRRVRGARDVAAFVDELLNEGTDVEVLSFARPILGRLDACTTENEEAASPELKASESLQFLPEEVAPGEGTCPIYGVLTTQQVSPRHCVLTAAEGI